MEVVVLGSDGIPSNSILSMRAGTTRRQSMLSSIDKPFRFPCKLEECTPLKIDIYDLTGTARAICRSNLPEQKLQLGRNDMAVTFKVQALSPEEASKGMHPTPSEEAKKSMSVKTDRYLEKHNVPTFMQSILTSLIKEKPDDPYQFIASLFYAEAKRIEPNLVVPPSGEVEALKQELQEEKEKLAQYRQQVTELRALVEDRDGKVREKQLEKEVAELKARVEELQATPPSPDRARDHVLGCLLAGAENGQLERLLSDAAEAAPKPPATAGSTGRPVSAKAVEAFEQIDTDHDGMLSKQEFAEAFDGGVLEQALDVEGIKERVEIASREGESLRNKIENLNVQLESLLRENQELRATLSNQKTEHQDLEMEDVRATAREILTSGLQTGDLARALETVGEHGENEDVRGMAAILLTNAARSGELLNALEKSRGDEPEAKSIGELRKCLRVTLTNASKDGTLRDALSTMGPLNAEADDVDDLCTKMRSTLQRGSLDGRLESFLEMKLAAEMQEDDETDDLRQSALATFKSGLDTGALAEMLQLKKPPADEDDVDDLKKRAKRDMLDALKSGRLEGELASQIELFTDAHDLEDGEEVVRLYDGVTGRAIHRTTTDVFVQLENGAEVWCAVEDLGQKGMLTAPHMLEEGEKAVHVPDRTKGTVKIRTTTEVCVMKEDGTEMWYPIEDVAQLLPHAINAREGDVAVVARNGAKGQVLRRTTTDVHMKLDDGKEVWEGVEEIAKPPPKFKKKPMKPIEEVVQSKAVIDKQVAGTANGIVDQAMSKAVDKLAVAANSPLQTRPFKEYYREYMVLAKTPTDYLAKVCARFPSKGPSKEVTNDRPVPARASSRDMDALERLHAMLEELALERSQLLNQVDGVSASIRNARRENAQLREQVLSRPCSREVRSKFGL